MEEGAGWGGAKVEEGGKGEGERAQGLSPGFSAKNQWFTYIHVFYVRNRFPA